MILRDHLALDRSALANERTFLSYVRTALAFVGGGVGAFHFFAGPLPDLLGGALVAAGLATGAIGVQRFRAYKRRFDVLGAHVATPRPNEPGDSA